jgi:arylsulfatase A-like enzyme
LWHYPHYGNQVVRHCDGTPGASVRDGDWKLIRFFEDGHEELYNLKEDIGETKNLADAEPGKREQLSAKLTAWSEEIEGLGVPLDT